MVRGRHGDVGLDVAGTRHSNSFQFQLRRDSKVVPVGVL